MNTESAGIARAVPSGPTASLRGDSVRFLGTVASAVGIQAPTAGVTFLPALMAGIVGEAGPLTFLLALVAMLLVAYAFVIFSSEFTSAGSVFAFNGRTLGASYGFLSAWLLLAVYVAYSASIFASNANFLENLARSGGISIGWPACAVLFWAVALVLAYRRISVSTLVIFILEGISILLVASVAVVVVAKGGSGGHGISAAPFTTGGIPLTTIGLGVVFAFTGFSVDDTGVIQHHRVLRVSCEGSGDCLRSLGRIAPLEAHPGKGVVGINVLTRGKVSQRSGVSAIRIAPVVGVGSIENSPHMVLPL